MGEIAATGLSGGGRILRLFGLAGSQEDQPARSTRADQPAANASLGHAGRRELMDRIGGFLIENDLDVSPENLTRAHAAFSGADLRLGGKIAARQLAGERITQEWFDAVSDTPPAEEDLKSELDQLMSRLDTSITAFTDTTRSARSAAADYNAELETHVATVQGADAAGMILTSLADIAKSMLERTKQVETEMRSREREAEALRKSLEKAQRDAEIDHLTGLPNRRAFEGVLETVYREAQREIEPLCVAFCDIDHFKRINDTHGHEAGDRVIQAIARTLAHISNEKCHVARHGGEEFVMLFRGMSKQEAHAQLDEARARMADRQFINRITDEPIGTITFSGGIADVFAYADPRKALRAADQALYRAKEEGRNRIELA